MLASRLGWISISRDCHELRRAGDLAAPENRRTSTPGKPPTPHAAGDATRRCARGDGACPRILGLGLGAPGLVGTANFGTLLFAPNLGGAMFFCARFLEAEFAFPIYVDNEANMTPLGQSYFGVARGSKSVLYVSAWVGLGGGIVLDSRVLTAAPGSPAKSGI